jgi:DNA (cytosine-5)-methyltransferase 1
MGKKHSVISLFSGAMGLDLGLEAAGFETRVAVECNVAAVATIRANRPTMPLIPERIEKVPTSEILARAGLAVGEATVVTGGPSCQAFSTAGQRGSVGDPRGAMFREFLRVVREARPRFFVMENVRGMLSAAVKHRPLNKRGPGYPLLKQEEQLGSAFNLILQELKSLGYYVIFDLVNAADYGAPQTRERILFIGSRDGEIIPFPARTHARTPSNGQLPWVTLRQAIADTKDTVPEYSELTPAKKKFLELVAEGGNWRDLPERLKEEALGAAFVSWGGRSGFCRRLAWNEPAPALTTKPDGRATMLCHPVELRPLSVSEYARIQQFPVDWQFAGSVPQRYQQIGNAVPIALGRAAGESILAAMRTKSELHRLGLMVCPDALLARLRTRHRTILNPPRMRKNADIEASKAWKLKSTRGPRPIIDLITRVGDAAIVPNGSRDRRRLAAHRATWRMHAAFGSPDHGNKPDPLDELIFIVLSQMTTHHSFNRVYDRLKEAAPTWDAVASMRLAKLRRLIKDAGLSDTRARWIKDILAIVRADFGAYSLSSLASLSDAEVERYLTGLPGVGIKTAKCVLMYALRRNVLPVDTHVWRVAQRLGFVHEDVSRERVHAELETIIPPTDRYAFHVNALVLGREFCIAARPRCGECPMLALCVTGTNQVARISTHATRSSPKRSVPSRVIVIAGRRTSSVSADRQPRARSGSAKQIASTATPRVART